MYFSGLDNLTAPLATLPPTAPVPPPIVAQTHMSTFDYVTEAVATALNVYYTPILIILGIIGNLVSIFVFYTTKLRFQSTSYYLSILAISDSVFLLQLVPPWLNAIQYTNLFHRPGFCQVFVYSTYVSCCLSAWLVAAFTIERFVAVLYPLRRNTMCTVARAKWIISLLVVFAMILNIPVIKYAATSTNDCNIDFEYMEHAARFNYVDTAIAFTLPLVIIIFLNGLITLGVYRLAKARRALLRAELAACEGACPPPPPPPLRSQHRVTRMLLIVSSVFVILNVPAYTMRILAYAYDMSTSEYSGRWAALQQLALMFFNTNFGINFILYCLSGQNFRRALCQSTSGLLRRTPRGDDMRLRSRNNLRASSVTTSCGSAVEYIGAVRVLAVEAPAEVRRHRSEPIIERWIINNRGRRDQPNVQDIEMQVLRPPTPLPGYI